MPENLGKVFSRIFNFLGRYEDVLFDFRIKAELSFSYNYVINNDPSSTYHQKRILYTPLYKWTASFFTEYKKIFSFLISYRYLSERFINEENTVWLEPYGIMDIEASLYFLYFAVENVFDVSYEEINGYPQMGRYFKGGIRFEF